MYIINLFYFLGKTRQNLSFRQNITNHGFKNITEFLRQNIKKITEFYAQNY